MKTYSIMFEILTWGYVVFWIFSSFYAVNKIDKITSCSAIEVIALTLALIFWPVSLLGVRAYIKQIEKDKIDGFDYKTWG